MNRSVANLPVRRRLLGACALAIALCAGNALGADEYDRIVVRFRDDAVAPASTALPADHVQRLATQLQAGFRTVGRGRDGSFEVELDTPLSLDEARAALNRVRLDGDVLYANLAPMAGPLARGAAPESRRSRAPNQPTRGQVPRPGAP